MWGDKKARAKVNLGGRVTLCRVWCMIRSPTHGPARDGCMRGRGCSLFDAGKPSRDAQPEFRTGDVCYTVFGIAFSCSADALLKALKRMQKNFCKSLSRKSCFQKGAPISAAHRNCSPLSGSIALLHSLSSYIAALGFTLVLWCRAIRFVRLFTSTLA